MAGEMMLARVLGLLAAAVALTGATAPHPGVDWNTHVEISPVGGDVIGNPDAPLKLVEYMSYTCPHCAAFEVEGVPTLRLALVAKGEVSFEVRHFLRDPIDATVAQLTHCAAPQRFMILHEAFLHSQPQWIAVAQHATQGQTQRWSSGDNASRRRAIASDLGFYTIMENHGIERIAADRCLADEALAHRIAAQTESAEKLGVEGTPSFSLNGALLAGTYTWQTLEPQLQARL